MGEHSESELYLFPNDTQLHVATDHENLEAHDIFIGYGTLRRLSVTGVQRPGGTGLAVVTDEGVLEVAPKHVGTPATWTTHLGVTVPLTRAPEGSYQIHNDGLTPTVQVEMATAA